MSKLEESSVQEDLKIYTSNTVIHRTTSREDNLLVTHRFSSAIRPEKSEILFQLENFETILKFHRSISTPVYTLPNTDFEFLLEVKLQEDGHVSLFVTSALDKKTVVIDLTVCFSMLSETQAKLVTQQFEKNTWKPLESHGFQKFVTTEQLVREKSRFLPNDTLTVLCEVVRYRIIENTQEETFRAAPGTIVQNYLDLYDSSICSDCRIVVDGTTFNAHKAIIAAQSAFFRKIFTNPNMKADAESVVKIDGVNPKVFKEVLRFMYSGKVSGNLMVDNTFELLRAAQIYQIDSLKILCVRFIETNVSVENVTTIFANAILLELKDIQQIAMAFFNEHMEEIRRTESFKTFKLLFPTHTAAKK